jgi:hypothetical protein
VSGPEPGAAIGLEPRDRPALALLLLLALAMQVASAVAACRSAGIPLSHLGAFFDGHLYLQIAKSFPMPYSAEGPAYAGQAPGYSALIYLGHLLVPDSVASWGGLALLASWVPAVLAVGAFYVLCKVAGVRPFWPSALFVLANPRWVVVASGPFPECLTVLLIILVFIAYLRDRLGWCVALLTLAALTRFPAILLGGPIAVGALLLRRRVEPKTFALLALPLIALALWNAYLLARIPGFTGVWDSHQIFWETHPTWPFAELLRGLRAPWPTFFPAFEVTYGSLLIYLAAIAVGFRSAERELWVLPLWVATIVVFHASLSGEWGIWSFTRFVILAWPATVLILWRATGERAHWAVLVPLCVVAGAFSLWFAHRQTWIAVGFQSDELSYLEETIDRLDSDEPHWVDSSDFETPPETKIDTN